MSSTLVAPAAQTTLLETFDLYAPPAEFYESPYPYYKALRELDPVHENADGSFYLTRYEDVRRVYRTKGMTSDKTGMFTKKYGPGALLEQHTTSMLFSDPPYHTRIRNLLRHAFTPRALQQLEHRVVELVDGLIEQCRDRGEMDLVLDFAFPLPVEVICTMLGIDTRERERLQEWSREILTPLEPTATPEMIADGNRAVDEFTAFLRDLLEEKRANMARGVRAGDILEDLIDSQESEDDPLTADELVQNCILLLNGGHETTTNLVSNGMKAMFDNPDQLRKLHDDPSLIGGAIEEMLRFDSPLQIGNRGIAEPFEVGGTTLAPGTQILTSIGGANHDPDAFDQPEVFDITRTPNKHLAFAAGIHACIGAPLARMEGTIAIGKLVAAFPDMQRTGPISRGGRARFRGLTSMPVSI
ncbi:MAG: cytochrome P450 [Rhodospirillaceae bacterium]|nr:cytochrome P450 [Rhodospirillaceae bacterium]MBT6402948.1 cytochrome P450 [Rhodospirillaceae bacterium]MBT6537025.1 cytochrome P450 [Rhodospirillaceae bacterium]